MRGLWLSTPLRSAIGWMRNSSQPSMPSKGCRPSADLSTPAVTELYDLYEKSREQVPFKQFYALRNGWRVFPRGGSDAGRRSWSLRQSCSWSGTLHLTRIYNRGVDISAALTALEESEAEIRYGELERRLLDAQDQLGDAAVAPGEAVAAEGKLDTVNQALGGAKSSATLDRSDDQFLLAREASHRLLIELVDLDQRIYTRRI